MRFDYEEVSTLVEAKDYGRDGWHVVDRYISPHGVCRYLLERVIDDCDENEDKS